MNKSIKSRSVAEYTVPMVSIDGESHSEIILIAVVSGIIVASIILITLGILLKRRQKKKLPNDEICKRNIFTIFQNRKSVDLANPTFRTTCMNETGLENINGNIQDSNVITRYYGQCQEGEFYKRETVAF